MTATRAKRKQKTKAGRVVRLRPELQQLLEARRREKESVSETLERLIYGEVHYYILPSDVFVTLAEARGAAVMRKVRDRAARAEKPVAIREVLA